LLKSHGCLLVFDEVITGFRFSLGGAQELYGAKPDLSCFGKSMGNGMPISAVVGRADIMAEMEEIFFSGTFGGECLSIAASIAVIKKMQSEPVIESIWKNGQRLTTDIEQLIKRYGLEKEISLVGSAPWKIISFEDHAHANKELIRTVFIQEMLHAGILMTSSHNLCYAHGDEDFAALRAGYERALGALRDGLESKALDKELVGPIIDPIFKVR
jgi:glutamate-1-semialdehyde 2,1-aminomutase